MAADLRTLVLQPSTNRAAGLVLALTLVGYPLAAGVSEFAGIPNRLLSVPFRALVLGASLFVLLRLLDARPARTDRHPVWIAWWLFWGLYVSRIVVDALFNPDALKLPVQEYLLFGVGVTLLPAAVLASRRLEVATEATARLILLLGFVGTLLNLWVILHQLDFASYIEFATNRVETDSLNPITIGQVGASSILLATWQLLHGSDRGGRQRLWLAACIALGSVALIASASRGPMISMAVAGLVLLAHERRLIPMLWIAGIAATLPLLLAEAGLSLDSVFLFERLSESAFTDSERSRLFADGLRAFQSSPLIGAGIEPIETYPHNLWLESFMVFGLPSGLAFSAVLIAATLCAWRIRATNPSAFWISLLFVQYLVSALFSGSLYTSSAFWILCALVLAIPDAGRPRTAAVALP